MATRTLIICDKCESEASQTTTMALNAKTYEVDLCQKCSDGLDKVLSPYLQLARVTGGPRRSTSGAARRPAGNRAELTAIREWARGKGYEVSDRGRIPFAIVEEFKAQAS